jgi:drug/metabolite transporter (DMT)-like permease
MGCVLALAVASFVWIWPTPAQWLLMASLGGTMAVAQLFFLKSMKAAAASFVTPFMYSTLIFATFFDFIVFGEWPASLSLLGGIIVVAGAILLAWREALAKERK